MAWLKSFWRNLFRRERVERELDEELSFHLDTQIEANVRAGMRPEEARRQAQLDLGRVEQVKEEVRATRPGAFLETLWQDVRFGARMLRKNPAFTFVAILTLALGIGANTAIFTVVKAVVLDALPYGEPQRLVFVAQTSPRTPRAETVDFTTTWDWRERNRSFENLSLYRQWSAALLDANEPELVQGMRVSWDYFDALGVKLARGRTFRKDEDQPDHWRVLVLTHGTWQRRFGGDPNIIGRKVRLYTVSYEIVGVLPLGFRPLLVDTDSPVPEFYAPLGYDLSQSQACRGCQHLHLIGRLKPGIRLAQANADLDAVLRDLRKAFPTSYSSDAAVRVEPLQLFIVGGMDQALWVLLGAVGLVLLIACANLANLLLARATSRGREIALRTSLGASRGRILRQLLTESLLLAFAGGAAGVLLGVWGTELLVVIAPKEIPRLDEIELDVGVLAFSLAVTLLTGVSFGLAPALRATRVRLTDALKDASRATDSGARHGLRSLLVAGQLALTFLLMLGTTLLGRSFLNLIAVDPGFEARNVLTVGTYVWGERYQKAEAELDFYRQVMEKTRALPGVNSVAMVSTLPFSGFDRAGLHLRHRPVANPSDAPSADRYSVTPDYFRVMRIPLKRGRLFTEADIAGVVPVAIISESCAREQFLNEDPIGKQIQLGAPSDDRPWFTIVGIVGNVQQYALDRPATMQVYTPQAQELGFSFTLLVRTTSDPRHMAGAVRGVLASVDKTQPVQKVAPLEDYLAASLAQRRFTLTLVGAFGALALLMAAVGIYGVISYTVSLRTREVGVRMALGAQAGDVLAMVLRQGLAIAVAGLGVGYVASLALTQLLTSLLYNVHAHDFLSVAIVAGLLFGVAFVATYLPARRATRVDPMVALRYE